MSKLSVVFPGQGSQRPTMGMDFYNEYPIAKEIFEKASKAIDCDLKEICFSEDERLNLTEYTQPAILTVEIAMYEVIKKEFNFVPVYFAGHSLGEYTALVAAEVIPFENAVKIVKKRGNLMQTAVPEGKGTMAALICENIPQDKVKVECEKNNITMANINSKNQIVISGSTEETQKTANTLKNEIEGLDVVFLNVSAPFHSSLMKEIENDFNDCLKQYEESFKKYKAETVMSNYTGKFHTAENLLENLVKQISGSVKWLDNMSQLQNVSDKIYEIGPNKPLGKFFKTIGADVISIINLRGAKSAFVE
ncbi:MAG: ACP S-malonyltransferase [Spirochaetia bacterium]|nr:ACP S-malonyltransferase [Spirochaetia bacterium]